MAATTTDTVTSFVSREEFNLFHSADRDLYKLLVINLGREPSASMQVMALYLWLELMGYRYLVKKILSLPLILVNDIADEATACLAIVVNPILASTSSFDIPLLQNLVDKPISLQFFYENHVAAGRGVGVMMQEVCMRAFSDIMQFAMMRNYPYSSSAAETTTTKTNIENSQVVGLPTQLVFGSIGPSNLQNQLVPADDRTMFLTFSKGYPVNEMEVRKFLGVLCGEECIEGVHMQEVQPSEQSLFARVVFHEAPTIDLILRGEDKIKFSINGKHVWARKFVSKRKVSLPQPSPAHFQNHFAGASSASNLM
ncbi:hypothetical protein L6164_011811 [Bauhinia variegata]|uniref:Uncharacterized protein n=1 Tax=Bauhinia variegata TaxID=167791 RepID=A0ACB9P9P2_BAUVA|nr:hypothetical protein L6164_011811 [Bauhinia variegata]